MVLKYALNSEMVNTVYKTSDLLIFKHIKGNRIPNLKHVRRLVDSIKKYGMKCNPILVNEQMEVIDGQHRLLAAKETNSFVYYIIINGYSLSEVHTLNLNQKNWQKKDYMEAYANMNYTPYVNLRNFCKNNSDFNFTDCIALCQNTAGGNSRVLVQAKLKDNETSSYNLKEIFEHGTWLGGDFELAQDWADKIRTVKPYYKHYNRTTFVGTIISLFLNPSFDFNEFMDKLRLQPTALTDCANREQYKTLIEDIYNFRRKHKINLRY
jgi:hypothetical protein